MLCVCVAEVDRPEHDILIRGVCACSLNVQHAQLIRLSICDRRESDELE